MIKTRLALLPLGAFLVIASCSPADDPSTHTLGSRVSGTWYGTFEIDAPGLPAPFIRTFHTDGTGVATSSRMFGAGDAERYGLSSTQHIQWETTGEREITWRLLHFGHDPDGSLRYVSRTWGVEKFDEEFETSRGSIRIEVLDPANLADPLDLNNADVEPIFTGSGTSLSRRLHIRMP
jgi:hypothetical protein